MKTNFVRKPTIEELLPQDEFVVEKMVEVTTEEFESLISEPLQDFPAITAHKDLMFQDNNRVFHCIFIFCNDYDFGFLVESEGYDYMRYASYYPKILISKE